MGPIGVFFLGPTASGKSRAALNAAEKLIHLAPEIVNADSIQFYSKLVIGSARPSDAEMQRVPHHLFGTCPAGSIYTAGDFRRDVLRLVRDDAVYFVVGGSGFYTQALEKGMYPVASVNPEIKEQLQKDFQQNGLAALYGRLSLLDPEYARSVSIEDRYRILRALEVILSDPQKRSLSDIRMQFNVQPQAPVFPTIIKVGIMPERERLLEDVERRTQTMLEAGLVAEVEQIVAEGHREWRALQSVGYREVLQYLSGDFPLAELQSRIVQRTLALCKKQRTWFKRDASIRWVASPEEAVKHVLSSLNLLNLNIKSGDRP